MPIRRAVESDLEAIHHLLEQLMQAERDQRHMTWGEALETAGYAAWVVEVDGKPVGFIDLFVLPDVAHGSKIGLVNNLVIDERFRGRGLGAGLLREAIHQCRQQGAAELHVWTDPDNTPAIGLYKRFGFVDRALLLELEVGPGSLVSSPGPVDSATVSK